MSPFLLSVVLVLVLVGCQSGDTGVYDKQAKDEALREAGKGAFDGAGDVVSVGPARERRECPQAPSAQAGPCLEIDVTTELPLRDTSGELDSLGRKVRVTLEAFVWLKKNDEGRWTVTHRTYRPKGAPDEPK